MIDPSELESDPWNLVKGEIVWTKIVASNDYGDSPYSVAGSGATLMLVPDAPINLQNDVLVTSSEIIQFTWREGLSDGGSPVLDYTVFYDPLGLGNFEKLGQRIKDEVYNTTFELS